jgi:release factor glutamine methyltransferase
LQSKTLRFSNSTFVVPENVYEPAEDTFLFIENLDVPKGAQVLDVGTGCGILGILAAKRASSVLAVDLNPAAINCARENARLNNLQNKIFFVRGDLLTSLAKETRFDLILFNAPYLPVEEGPGAYWLDLAWNGGVNGRQVIDRFIKMAPEHLNKRGQIFLMQSTLAGVDETIRNFESHNLSAGVVAKRNLPFFETLLLIRALRLQ